MTEVTDKKLIETRDKTFANLIKQPPEGYTAPPDAKQTKKAPK